MNNMSLELAFSAGLLSFLSPCVLPLIPAYISYLAGTSIAELNNNRLRLNTFYKSIGFVLGFSIIFIVMGASITSLGKLLINYQIVFRKVGGILIILFGLHTLGLFKIKILYYEKKFLLFNNVGENLNSVLMGMAFATGWILCIGPIFSSILIYSTTMETINRGILLLVVYSLGLAVPFLLTALAIGSFSKNISKFLRYLPIISKLIGTLIILMGIMVFINKVSILSQYLNFINF